MFISMMVPHFPVIGSGGARLRLFSCLLFYPFCLLYWVFCIMLAIYFNYFIIIHSQCSQTSAEIHRFISQMQPVHDNNCRCFQISVSH